LTLKLIAMLGLFAVCALPPAVAAAAITVPPGSTEGDQYFEEVPNGGGSGSVNNGSGGGGGGGGAPVAATQALDALGPQGQAAANLANANRPPEQGKANQSHQQSGSQQASSSEGEGGMGFLFPLLLVVTALAAVGYGLRRRLNPA
jgi:hypothetical protein